MPTEAPSPLRLSRLPQSRRRRPRRTHSQEAPLPPGQPRPPWRSHRPLIPVWMQQVRRESVGIKLSTLGMAGLGLGTGPAGKRFSEYHNPTSSLPYPSLAGSTHPRERLVPSLLRVTSQGVKGSQVPAVATLPSPIPPRQYCAEGLGVLPPSGLKPQEDSVSRPCGLCKFSSVVWVELGLCAWAASVFACFNCGGGGWRGTQLLYNLGCELGSPVQSPGCWLGLSIVVSRVSLLCGCCVSLSRARKWRLREGKIQGRHLPV